MTALSVMKGEFPCLRCNKVLQSKAKLRVHLEIHDNLRPFACVKCDAAFKTNNNLVRHLREVHAEEDQYPCPLCDKNFKCLDYFYKHLKRKHIGGPFILTKANSPNKKQCSPKKKVDSLKKKVGSPEDGKVRSPEKKMVNGKPAVRRRLNVVKKKSSPALYKCSECKMSFTRKCDLKEDILSHQKKKALLARRAYQRAYSRYGLRLVGRCDSGSDDEGYECDKCGRIFYTRLELIEHAKRMHSNNNSPKKLFACSLGDMVYPKAFSLKAHQEYRHELLERNGYSCDRCGVHFIYRVNFQRHINHAECSEGTPFPNL